MSEIEQVGAEPVPRTSLSGCVQSQMHQLGAAGMRILDLWVRFRQVHKRLVFQTAVR